MKKLLIFICIIVFGLSLVGCKKNGGQADGPSTTPSEVISKDYVDNSEFHPEFLEQILEVKSYVDSQFKIYLQSTKKYQPTLKEDLLLFGNYAITTADSYEGKYGTNNLFTATYYIMWKTSDKACWHGRRFDLLGDYYNTGASQPCLYSLVDNKTDTLLNTALSFTDQLVQANETETGFNRTFYCLNYSTTGGYVNKVRTDIIKEYLDNPKSYTFSDTYWEGRLKLSYIN